MRILPVSLSARLFLALCGSILAAQLVGTVVFLYDHRVITARWSAIGWSDRVVDLVRMLDTLDATHREQAVAAMGERRVDPRTADSDPVGFNPSASTDAEFMRFFRQRVQQMPRATGSILISTEQSGFRPDLELDALTEYPAAGKPSFYDVRVPFADSPDVRLRLRVVERVLPTISPYRLLVYPLALLIALIAGTWVLSRGVTVPLARLSSAADALGRGRPHPALEEEGPRELRRAAHAFNSMQDRLRRYLDSRTRVVAAMSHDLRTPITRMMLRVEAVSDPGVQAKLNQDLEEMQQMVQGALDMLQGLQSNEPIRPINIDALMVALRDDYHDLGFSVTVSGSMKEPLAARPQAWRRLLTNLLDNCRKFATQARLEVEEQGHHVIFRVKDDGPGIPEDLLERVLEPYYRIEESRSRSTGGIGLGLSIARDIAQAHGGDLHLKNQVGGGLEAIVSIPRHS